MQQVTRGWIQIHVSTRVLQTVYGTCAYPIKLEHLQMFYPDALKKNKKKTSAIGTLVSLESHGRQANTPNFNR